MSSSTGVGGSNYAYNSQDSDSQNISGEIQKLEQLIMMQEMEQQLGSEGTEEHHHHHEGAEGQGEGQGEGQHGFSPQTETITAVNGGNGGFSGGAPSSMPSFQTITAVTGNRGFSPETQTITAVNGGFGFSGGAPSSMPSFQTITAVSGEHGFSPETQTITAVNSGEGFSSGAPSSMPSFQTITAVSSHESPFLENVQTITAVND